MWVVSYESPGLWGWHRNHPFGLNRLEPLAPLFWVHSRADFFPPFWEVLKLTGQIFALRKWHIRYHPISIVSFSYISDWETIEVPYAVLYPHLWRDQRQQCHKLHLRRGLRPHLRWLWLGLKIASQLFFFPACWDLSVARWCSFGLDGTDILAADLCQNDAWLMEVGPWLSKVFMRRFPLKRWVGWFSDVSGVPSETLRFYNLQPWHEMIRDWRLMRMLCYCWSTLFPLHQFRVVVNAYGLKTNSSHLEIDGRNTEFYSIVIHVHTLYCIVLDRFVDLDI